MTVKFQAGRLMDRLTRLSGVKAQVMPRAFQTFVQSTPVARINGGNARSNTRLKNNDIIADYGYAGVLDAGRGFRHGQMRGSTQAPEGMTKPTIDFIQQEVIAYINAKGK